MINEAGKMSIHTTESVIGLKHQLKRNRSFAISRYLISSFLNQIQTGQLTITFPDGKSICNKTKSRQPEAHIHIHSASAIRHLLFGGSIGFAESYMKGHWDSPDLAKLIELIAINGESFAKRLTGNKIIRLFNYLAHKSRKNSRKGSKSNIEYHYDLGNEFYQKWLDEKMIYSSAIYTSNKDTLEEAQERKLARIIDLLAPQPQQNVLEIGCGWGALSKRIASEMQANVLGITLSKEQKKHSQSVAAQSNISNKMRVDLLDYRDVNEKFDRIVSIEMIEAVGEEYWSDYFNVLHKSLTPDGHAVIQAITIDEARFTRYRKSPDFIQKYIFPGGALPTKTLMRDHAERAGLEITHQEFFGESYARTLCEWRTRFQRNWPEIQPIGFNNEFYKMWNFYLAYCEGAFNAGSIDVGLYVFRPIKT